MEEINYDIMRYDLSPDGYVYQVYFGCASGTCTGYTGAVPDGYSSLEDWAENANIRAYKVIDGNLVYDSNRDSQLQEIYEQQEADCKCVTYKELEEALKDFGGSDGEISINNSDEIAGILPILNASGNVIVIDDASSFEVPYMKLTSDESIANRITIICSTPNLLPNEAVTITKSGLTMTVNEDYSITVTGEASGADSISIAGSLANAEPLFMLKSNVKYYLSELPSGMAWHLYYYDKSELEEVYSGNGGVLEFTQNKAITFVEIGWTLEETVATNVKFYPALNVGSEALPYEQHQENRSVFDLGSEILTASNSIEVEDGSCTLGNTDIYIDRVINTYYEDSVIYAIENVHLDVDYKKSGFDTVVRSGNGAVNLRNTADGYGSIFGLTIKNLAGGETYTLETSDNDGQSEQYTIDLTDYEGDVDVVIEKGEATVRKNGSDIGILDNIYIRTYSPRTYIELLNCTNRMTCEYMVESEFSVYCTIVEKNASIKMVEDKIALEVTRASNAEGQLESKIEIEADKIKQIVASVGADGKVTAASIILAINEDEESEIKINADKIDITGLTFPTIQNADGTNYITSVFEIGDSTCIAYKSTQHRFLNDDEEIMLQITHQAVDMNGQMINIGTSCPYTQIGGTGTVNLCGTVLINGEEIGTGGGTGGDTGGGNTGGGNTGDDTDEVRNIFFATYENISIPTSLWVEDTTYEQFGYSATIPCEGVTADYVSEVVFDVVNAVSGNFAPISMTGEGTVTIYAVNLPDNITIPTIKITGTSATDTGIAVDILTFKNRDVSITSWVEDNTYEEFCYSATILCDGVTSEYYSEVTFNMADALSGNYAPVSLTGEGTVTIYSVGIPNEKIELFSIVCSKGA